MFNRRLLTGFAFAAFLGLGFLSNFAFAAVPQDEAGFTAYVSASFQKAMPGYRFTIVKPLALLAKGFDPSDTYQFDLHAILTTCQLVPARCEEEVALHAHQMAASTIDGKKPIERSTLRIAIRTQDYVAKVQQVQTQGGKGDAVAVPFMDGLWILCVSDLPTAIKTVTPVDLKQLNLTPDKALFLGTDNVAAALPPLMSRVHKLSKDSVGLMTGDPYESSRMMLFESWAPLAKRYKGELLVAVPAPDVILYAKNSGPKSIDRLSMEAREITLKVPRPLTNSVFRWTEKGWQLVLPGDKFGPPKH